MRTIEGIRLENTTPPHNKEYRVSIIEEGDKYTVKAEFGSIGRNLTVDLKGTYTNLENANSCYSKIVQSKLNKGYITNPPKTLTTTKPKNIKMDNCKTITDASEYLNSDAYIMQEVMLTSNILLKNSKAGVRLFTPTGNGMGANTDIQQILNNTKDVDLNGFIVNNTYYVSDIYFYEDADLRPLRFSTRLEYLQRYFNYLKPSKGLKLIRWWSTPRSKKIAFDLLEETDSLAATFIQKDSTCVEGVESYLYNFKQDDVSTSTIEDQTQKAMDEYKKRVLPDSFDILKIQQDIYKSMPKMIWDKPVINTMSSVKLGVS